VVSFTPRPIYPPTYRIRGWVGPRAALDDSQKRKFNCDENTSSLLQIKIREDRHSCVQVGRNSSGDSGRTRAPGRNQKSFSGQDTQRSSAIAATCTSLLDRSGRLLFSYHDESRCTCEHIPIATGHSRPLSTSCDFSARSQQQTNSAGDYVHRARRSGA
jgi:hypothetical protein